MLQLASCVLSTGKNIYCSFTKSIKIYWNNIFIFGCFQISIVLEGRGAVYKEAEEMRLEFNKQLIRKIEALESIFPVLEIDISLFVGIKFTKKLEK